jgi:hypothetical protein
MAYHLFSTTVILCVHSPRYGFHFKPDYCTPHCYTFANVPYIIAILSHFLIGDIITGNPPLFYGFSDQTFGNFSTTISSEYGKGYEMLYSATVEVAMVGLFVMYTITKKNLAPLFSFPMKHVLILGLVVLSIFIGTLDSQIHFATTSQNNIAYSAYLMILFAQIFFLAISVRGTSRVSVRQLTKAGSN